MLEHLYVHYQLKDFFLYFDSLTKHIAKAFSYKTYLEQNQILLRINTHVLATLKKFTIQASTCHIARF